MTSFVQRIGAAFLVLVTALLANFFPGLEKDPKPTTTTTTAVSSTQEGLTGKTTTTTTTKPAEDAKVRKARQILGFSFDFEDNVYYTVNDAWQRNFGYTAYYDVFAEMLVMYYDTVRITFSYQKKDWMVQMWKGQYGWVFMGAEIGVYSKDPGKTADFYECVTDGDRLKIGYVCYSYDQVLFTRTSQYTWWLTGFVPGKLDRFSDRSQLSLKLNIKFEDSGMKDAFLKGLLDEKCGFKYGEASIPARDKDTFFVIDDTVYIMWNSDRNEETLPA